MSDQNPVFPLYVFDVTTKQVSVGDNKIVNLNTTIINEIAARLGLLFTNEKEAESEVCFINSVEVRPEFRSSFAIIDILDYIYAVLYSATYRQKGTAFLKTNFLAPYPKDTVAFWKLVKLGGELRNIHLLRSPVVNKCIPRYPIEGSNKVSKVQYEKDKVHINNTQYFDNVPAVAWQFYIGNYQPAKEWLKDQENRELSVDDILHYQKIIVALMETDRLIRKIDEVEIE